MNIAQGNLTIVDGNLFWKGQFVLTESLMYHRDEETKLIKVEVRSGDETVLTDMEASGVKIRRLK